MWDLFRSWLDRPKIRFHVCNSWKYARPNRLEFRFCWSFWNILRCAEKAVCKPFYEIFPLSSLCPKSDHFRTVAAFRVHHTIKVNNLVNCAFSVSPLLCKQQNSDYQQAFWLCGFLLLFFTIPRRCILALDTIALFHSHRRYSETIPQNIWPNIYIYFMLNGIIASENILWTKRNCGFPFFFSKYKTTAKL